MSSFSSSSALTEEADVSPLTAFDPDSNAAAEGEGSFGWAKLGEGSGARDGKSVRREPGVWPLKKLSGVASAERRRARIAY